MANEYQKINTLFLRDENNIIIPTRMTCAEFEYLKDVKWEATEKIDGTNIHLDLEFTQDYDENGVPVDNDWFLYFCGRTENAQIPKHLKKKLMEIFQVFPDCEEEGEWCESPNGMLMRTFSDVYDKMTATQQTSLTISIYGEGYGVKIQKGGNYIKNDVGFILFDVKVGDWWLNREACEEIAKRLNIPIVPLIGYMTISEAIEFVKNGFKSTIAENPDYDAEGLVLKTPYGLQFRNGQRIITKIKTCDFQKYRMKYGDTFVEQKPNPNYNK